MRTYAILPVKRFGEAKQRLDPALDAAARRDLAEAMVGDVLAALREVRELEGLIVVTGERAGRALAADAGAVTVDDALDAGQSAAATRGIARAFEAGAERVLLVPGDCPALDPAEVAGLVAAGGRPPAVTVVPDRHGTGTNALLLAPLEVIAPAFGPGSRERHEDRVREAGAALTVTDLPSLALDVDTGSDLAALRERLDAIDGGAPRTRAALAGMLDSP